MDNTILLYSFSLEEHKMIRASQVLPVIVVVVSVIHCSPEKNIKPMCHATLIPEGVAVHSSEPTFSCAVVEHKRYCGMRTFVIPSDDIALLTGGEEKEMKYAVYEDSRKLCEGRFKIPKEKMRFAVIGDTSYRTKILHLLVQEITKFQAHVVFHVGDLQYETTKDDWNTLLRYLRPIIETSFFQLVAGNHEYESPQDIRTFHRLFPHEGNFLFRWNGITFWGFNAFKEGWTKDVEATLSDLGDHPVFLFTHKPFVSIAGGRNFSLDYENVLNALRGRLAVAFAGHDHLYGRITLDVGDVSANLIISGGGGAELYSCPRETDVIRGTNVRARVQFCKSIFNVVLCELERQNLRCKAVSPKGKTIDEFSIAVENKS